MKAQFAACLLVWLTISNFGGASSTVKASGSVPLPDNSTINVGIWRPSYDGIKYGSELYVGTVVTSTYELKSVTANIDGRETPLSRAYVCPEAGPSLGCAQGWSATLSLEGLARGEKRLTVTATDVFNNTGQSARIFIYDKRPTVTVTAPLDDTVARPSLQLSASCSDDDPAGCASLSAAIDYTPLATGVSSINQSVSLAGWEGRYTTVTFKALDSAGQETTVQRGVYVEASAQLNEVETVGGRILDVSPDRILFQESNKVLKMRVRASSQDIVLVDDPKKTHSGGYLTPRGAIFLEQTDGKSNLSEWRDGTLINLGHSGHPKVKGNYAIWVRMIDGSPSGGLLIRRDLISGTNTEIPTIDTNDIIGIDMAANGDIVYAKRDGWSGHGDTTYAYNIFRYRNGSAARLTNDTALWNTGPLTDGINVVYRKYSRAGNSPGHSIAMFGASGEVILRPAQQEPTQWYFAYQVNGGWVAFTRAGTAGIFQVWTRSPSEQEEQVSFFGTHSEIIALSPKGGVVFTDRKRTYLKEPDKATIDIGSYGSGRWLTFWQGGNWFVALGRTLFRVGEATAPAPVLLTEAGSERVIALDSVTWQRAPFPLTATQNFSPDKRTRIAVFVSNLELMPGEDASAVTAQAEDSQHRLYSLPVEYVGKVANFDWLTQVNVVLPEGLNDTGDMWMSISVRGAVSNRAIINIKAP